MSSARCSTVLSMNSISSQASTSPLNLRTTRSASLPPSHMPKDRHHLAQRNERASSEGVLTRPLDSPATLQQARSTLRLGSRSDRVDRLRARQGLALSRTLLPASRSMTSPSRSLSVTVMIRPAADDTTTRDGRPLAQAGASYVSDGPVSYAR